MSTLFNRRQSPRRGAGRNSRMHPGWACFLCALGSGVFGGYAMLAIVQWGLLRMSIGYPIFLTFISLALFIIGGRKAETLTDRK